MNRRTMGVAAVVWGAALACGVSRAGAEAAAPPAPGGFTGVASEAAADPSAAGFVAEDWTLVWADEFDADGPPDPAHWEFDRGLVRNRELQLYTDRLENARVEGGVLVIEAHKGQVPNPGYDPAAPEAHWQKSWESVPYTSAAVQSRGRHAMTYGRIAVRAKLPEGRGMWPAIWMLGEDYDGAGGDVPWPRCGEIDIMEYVGHVPDTVHVAVHTDARNHRHGNHPANRMKVDRLHEDFHTYAVQWDAEKIDFFIDDTRLMTYANDGADVEDPVSVWPFDKPHYLIMNIAVGGGWGGQQGVDDAIFPQRMEVDWVRVYAAAP